MKTTLLALSATAALLLVGCGGGGTTTDATTGYFVDAPVKNIDYDCGDGIVKTTGEGGSFSCQTMDQVRFSIGELVLGEIDALPEDGYVFPQDLLGIPRENTLYDARVTAMAQLLQSLDDDKDPSNGIVIPDAVKAVYDESMSFNPDDLIDYANEANVTLVETVTAQNHLRDTLQEFGQTISSTTTQQGGGYHGGGQGGHGTGQNTPLDLATQTLSTLTPELKDALAHMGNEERLAYDVYTNLYNYHKENNDIEVFQLYNIASNSEATHVQTVQSLVQRYNLTASDIDVVDDTLVTTNNLSNTIAFDEMPSGVYDIPAIQDLYNLLYEKGITSQKDALEVGCMVEVVDVKDLDHYIALAQESNATDVEQAFESLRSGSYNHYWAFDTGLKNLGIEQGCCAIEPALGYDWCQPDFPQNERGNH